MADTDLLTQKELAHSLGVCERTVRAITKRRQIPAVKIGNKLVRYHYPSVLEALQVKTPAKAFRRKPQTQTN